MNNFAGEPRDGKTAFNDGDIELEKSAMSAHYFQQVVEHSMDIICTIDAVGCFVSMNRAVEKILGYKAKEVIGIKYITFVHDDDIDKTNIKALALLKGNPDTNFINRYRKKNGNYAYISWSSIWSVENQLMYCIARDVTEITLQEIDRKAKEKKLSESEYLLTKVGKLARVGGWELDVATKQSKWSQVVYDIYELPYDYNPGLNDSLSFYNSPYREKLEKAVKKAILHGTPWDLETEITTANGKVIWVRSAGEAVYENKKIVKLHGIFMDIDRYHSNETVLNRSLDLLTQHNKQLKSFTHILSHNLRNHANNISMLTSFIDMDLIDKGNAELVTKLDKVSKNLNSTLDHLSDAIKIREQVIASEKINFKEIANDVMSLLNAEIKYHDVEIITDFLIPKLNFPKIYMESIFSNLISNSIKYRKEKEAPEIIISTYFDEDAECMVLEYQDNGIGIDLAANGDKVFGLYKTFTSGPDSHGVGLFLVKTQIESQGGTIRIESKPNVGTKFRIYFKAGVK